MIKFRGIPLEDTSDIDDVYFNFDGTFVYGNYVKYGEGALIVGDVLEASEDGIWPSWWASVVPKTVEQFTGLTDVNGKEIYEGDILRLSYEEPKTYIYKDEYDPKPKIIAPKKVTRTAQVTKDAGTFGVSIYKVVFMALRDVDKGRQTVEVIGNVHENPELLEADDD
ncbi:YopX family protein [Lactiplantibacillus plantarum]|uniref:YopX family protein n=1 Tax=Lactiplantibacillus plantarum TaxID=1590 RepID=UPI002103B98F|nr:YopX family protein [Lactiplantibacillus plantarum]MDN7039254.1 hypothetical protein [Lactiplantibacillus plantarum]UTV82598.1 YopX family protein [Lactiplantibacillus plantarum]